jgi:hypothetical protein
MIGNFRVPGAQASGDFQRRSLLIDCIDLDLRVNLSRVTNDQPRNIARTCGKIDNTHSRAGLYPAPYESRNETMAAEPAIQLPKPLKVALQLVRNGLRPIHHFQNGWIEASLHTIEVGAVRPNRLAGD